MILCEINGEQTQNVKVFATKAIKRFKPDNAT